MSTATLTPAQAHALFDILVHHELYAEIENFKWPDAIDKYGYPFRKDDGVQTTSPLLQTLLNKFVLPLPGLNSVSIQFWQGKCQALVAKLAEAELSESYDKGAIGSRKTLATAVSAVLEYVARGVMGGYPKKEQNYRTERTYDTSKAEDVQQAWEDALQGTIYGDLLDEVFDTAAKTGKLEEHSNIIQGAHEYILLNIASFMHHVFIMSPDGAYLLKLIENLHRLVPYMMIRQTLRVGNAASMINGMVRLVLTKLSVTAFTNWMGLSNSANDGMNLLQQIISQVMAWDTSEFQKRATKVSKTPDGPPKEIFSAIHTHVYASRSSHESARDTSVSESKSIVAVILKSASPSIDASTLSDHQHDIALDYYSTLLSIRDREELTRILCKLQPDLLTSTVRDLVSAYDPIIRAIHNAVDLSGTLSDAESFITDLIKTSKPKNKLNERAGSRPSSRPGSRAGSRSSSPAPMPKNGLEKDKSEVDSKHLPSVEDYVALVRRHIPSSHKFLHQIAKNGTEMTAQYRDYVKACVAEFREHATPDSASASPQPANEPAAGALTPMLSTIFSTLSEVQQKEVLPLLDAHSKHLATLKKSSNQRFKAILNPTLQHTTHGPGIYLVRWHALLDSTLITPEKKQGPVRRGWEVKGEMDAMGKKRHLEDVRRGGSGDHDLKRDRREGREEVEMGKVVEALGERFRELLRGMEVMGP